MRWSNSRILLPAIVGLAMSAAIVAGCCNDTNKGAGCDPAVQSDCVCETLAGVACERGVSGCICSIQSNNGQSNNGPNNGQSNNGMSNNGQSNNGQSNNGTNNDMDAGDDADMDADMDAPGDVEEDSPDVDEDTPQPPPRVRYVVTIQNLSHQPLGPAVAITHSPSTHFWREGEEASEGIRTIAERGVPFVFYDEVAGQEGVTEVLNRGIPVTPVGEERASYGPFPPGLTFTDHTSMVIEGQPGDVFTLASMLVATNDGFWGLESVELPAPGAALVYFADAFDAGTEENTEVSEHLDDNTSILGTVMLDGDPDGNVGNETMPHAPIAPHAGLQGIGELTTGAHGWGTHVARVIISAAPEGAERSYEVFVQNETHQPLGPCVAVAHDASAHVWRLDEAATTGIQTIAERGTPVDLLAELDGAEGLTQVTNSGLPITPMGHQTTTFGPFPPEVELYDHLVFPLSADADDVFSLASMLVVTNDGFWGVDSVALPESGVMELSPLGYDAGTEENSELSTDLDDGGSALSPMALNGDPNGNAGTPTDPRGVITAHPGIQGGGDLDPAVHGWTAGDRIALIRLERLEHRTDTRCLEGGLCP